MVLPFTTVTGTVREIKRRGTSTLGNPTVDIYLDDDTRPYRTRENSSAGYSADNYRDKRVTLTLTPRYGRVSQITNVE
jgi:hypothetical protein